MRSEGFLVLSLGAVLAAASPVPSGGAFSPVVVTGGTLLNVVDTFKRGLWLICIVDM